MAVACFPPAKIVSSRIPWNPAFPDAAASPPSSSKAYHMTEIPIHTARTAAYWRKRANEELTIVIPAYNCAAYLRMAVESCLHGPAAQVLIADDGSGPELRRVAATLEAEHPKRVRVLRSDIRRGTA